MALLERERLQEIVSPGSAEHELCTKNVLQEVDGGWAAQAAALLKSRGAAVTGRSATAAAQRSGFLAAIRSVSHVGPALIQCVFVRMVFEDCTMPNLLHGGTTVARRRLRSGEVGRSIISAERWHNM